MRDAIRLSELLDDAQPTLWQDKVRLDEGFWASLRAHPVPVREEAISAIGTWLAYRLHSLSASVPVSWSAVHGQFGAGFQFVRHLKPRFTDSLKIALAVYPEAKVAVASEGLVLHPSPPALPRAEAKRLGLS